VLILLLALRSSARHVDAGPGAHDTWRLSKSLLGFRSAGAAGPSLTAAASASRIVADAGRTSGVTRKPRPFTCTCQKAERLGCHAARTVWTSSKPATESMMNSMLSA